MCLKAVPDYPSSKSSICYGLHTFKGPMLNAFKHLCNQVLQNFQMTNTSLQSFDQDINTACALYESLHRYVQAMQSTFSDIEQKAKALNECEDYQWKTWIDQKQNHKYDDYSGSCILYPLVEPQIPSQKFKRQTFLVIIDSLSLPCQNTRKLVKRWTVYLDSFISYSHLYLKRDCKDIIKSCQIISRRSEKESWWRICAVY